MSKLYIGLMSGTSIDGIDGVLVDFENEKGNILASTATDYDKETKELLHSLCSSSDDEIEKAGAARVKLATFEADTVNNLLKKARISPKDVIAVGSHGQTIRHRPEKAFQFSLMMAQDLLRSLPLMWYVISALLILQTAATEHH